MKYNPECFERKMVIAKLLYSNKNIFAMNRGDSFCVIAKSPNVFDSAGDNSFRALLM